MARVLVIAYGNPLRSDDGLAWRAAEQFRQEASGEIEIVCVHQLTPELAELSSRVERVIFVDASQNGEPGELACEAVAAAPADIRFSHQLTPAQLISLAHHLYGGTPQAFCVSMCGACFEHGESLSPEVAQALPTLVTRMKTLVGQLDAASPLRPIGS
jgi:hydrogenase maturation protease